MEARLVAEEVAAAGFFGTVVGTLEDLPLDEDEAFAFAPESAALPSGAPLWVPTEV